MNTDNSPLKQLNESRIYDENASSQAENVNNETNNITGIGQSSTKNSKRNPYFEIREAALIETKEKKEVRKIIGYEIREKCRDEIDEYVDCVVGRFFTILKCREFSKKLQRCIYKYETPEYIKSRERKIMEEREERGESLLKTKDRIRHNRFIDGLGKDGWVPERHQKETDRSDNAAI